MGGIDGCILLLNELFPEPEGASVPTGSNNNYRYYKLLNNLMYKSAIKVTVYYEQSAEGCIMKMTNS